MNLLKQLSTLIILYLMNIVHSVLILKFKDMKQLSSLLNEQQSYYKSDYRSNKARFSGDDNHDLDFGNNDKDYLNGHVSLAKIIVPHGYDNNLEYDRKYKTHFKPLLKLRVIGGNNKLFKGVKYGSQTTQDTLAKLIRNNVNKEKILHPLITSFEKLFKHKAFKRLLKDVVDTVGKNKLRKQGLLWFDPNYELRTSAFQKSGEENEPHTLNSPSHKHKESSEEKDSFPKYNFWNYWTYEKSIHQDKCKGANLLEWNGICIETPPH